MLKNNLHSQKMVIKTETEVKLVGKKRNKKRYFINT